MEQKNYFHCVKVILYTFLGFLFMLTSFNLGAQSINEKLVGHWSLVKVELQEKSEGQTTSISKEIPIDSKSSLANCFGLAITDIYFHIDVQYFDAVLLSNSQLKEVQYSIITFVNGQDALMEVGLSNKDKTDGGQDNILSSVPTVRYNVAVDVNVLKLSYTTICEGKGQTITTIFERTE